MAFPRPSSLRPETKAHAELKLKAGDSVQFIQIGSATLILVANPDKPLRVFRNGRLEVLK